jgi:hypothetical protein
VGNLHTGHGAAQRDHAGEACQQRLVFLGVEAEAAGRDTTNIGHMRGLGEDDTRTAGRLGADVLNVPVGTEPVMSTVLTHRRDDDAVAGGHRPEADRLEKQWSRHAGGCPDGLRWI